MTPKEFRRQGEARFGGTRPVDHHRPVHG
jgi:hypothetical protein